MSQKEQYSIGELTVDTISTVDTPLVNADSIEIDNGTALEKITIDAQAVAATTGTHDANIAIDIGGTTYYIMLTSAVA